MKKLLVSLFVCLILMTGLARAEDVFSPQLLQLVYMLDYQYQSDEEQFGYLEYYQTPDQFSETKKGDCEDYAIHSYAILKYVGYEAQMFTVYFKESGHAVTVFKYYGQYNIFSNGFIYETPEIDPVDAVKYLYPTWKIICKFHPLKYGKINLWNHLMSDSVVSWRLFVPKQEVKK